MYSLELLRSRHSVRSFADDPLSESQLKEMKAQMSDINSHLQGMRFQLFTDSASPFEGAFGSYGIFRNVRNYIAAVVDNGVPDVLEIAGFAGEQAVMKAVESGLGTCFIGATFNRTNIPAQMRAGESIPFIIALGTPDSSRRRIADRLMTAAVHSRKMTPRDFFDDAASAVPYAEAVERYPLLPDALEAVACAPSAKNQRKVRIALDPDFNIFAATPSDDGYLPIDRGIAKFNFSQIIDGDWDRGNRALFFPF